MDDSIRVGFSFGIASAIITTLGLMVGLNAGTHSSEIVIGGILTIAVADSLSDALGIHLSEESGGNRTHKEIWVSTLSAFSTKFGMAVTFLVPLLLFPLETAINVNIIWGFLVLGAFSYHVGKKEETASWKVVLEHFMIALLVVIITQIVGNSISGTLGQP